MIKTVCVAGAGTMGSGIALASAQHGYRVILFDTNADVLKRAAAANQKILQQLEEKSKISAAEKTGIQAAITYTSTIDDCKAGLVIEAIVEKLEVKTNLFLQLAAINAPNCILASNTSSLSVTAIQQHLPHPERIAGLHFFNPAHLMKLVEVVKAEKTSDTVAASLVSFCRQLKKTPVVCIDSPGFIVNRVARHYYLEAMRLVQQQNLPIEAVDRILESSGFKMGPFKLMDMIGMDINLAVTTSLYEAFDHAIRFTPSPLQVEKVEAGNLGRKTGKGFYDYTAATT